MQLNEIMGRSIGHYDSQADPEQVRATASSMIDAALKNDVFPEVEEVVAWIESHYDNPTHAEMKAVRQILQDELR